MVCGFKAIRSSFNDASYNYIILMFTYLFFEFDLHFVREPFLVNYFFSTIVFQKVGCKITI